mmetsp:Transcript_14412/g.21628  ORF Transcript_14412/g.21628 Transcript_14412/m.21628 type:complete len:425 (-) Transcript_14412:116-1390(-)|eukprot:CAMPEP_0185020448 /NCGR_PEP_ID=MMETSP1103-20130426/3060_1 /TAXON_ID=36769 /ORGANISM="Paraphysomonas bandaiensis, Strain Caron Lab Isolate" /LENGTH=424 /DNA_ID=CAMNT_0027551357 /DNA_START=40 /DNA_END=1314 /DNA_ORIENTATION=-
MEEVYNKFNELYAIHDWYFCSDRHEKQDMMRSLIEEINSMLADLPEAPPGEVAFIKGKSLNAIDEFTASAEEWLTKAVKLDPSNVSAWIALGQCAWKKGNLSQAKHFLNESLQYGETQEALQDLSMITRQIRVQGEDPSVAMDESIRLAKRAIQLDLNDHKSWYVFGNAHCMRFFSVSQDVSDLKKALTAYTKSESLGGDCNPDLFYNRGNVHRYLQEYAAAVSSYARSVSIDPSFTEATEAGDDVRSFLTRTKELVAHTGYVQRKRLDKIVARLKSSRHSHGCVGFRSLLPGENVGTSLAVCVLMPATKGDIPPETFLCVDVDGFCGFVSMYNLGHNVPPPSPEQVLCVSAPYLNTSSLVPPSSPTEVDTTTDSLPAPPQTVRETEHPLLAQVYNLENVKVEGRALNYRAVAPPQLKVNLFDS